jgi:hypothetical protein
MPIGQLPALPALQDEDEGRGGAVCVYALCASLATRHLLRVAALVIARTPSPCGAAPGSTSVRLAEWVPPPAPSGSSRRPEL